MGFCSNCGTKAINETAKFCHVCGSPLAPLDQKSSTSENIKFVNAEPNLEKQTIVKENVSEKQESDNPRRSAYELGVNFENVVQDILKADGYSIESRVRARGEKGTSEIDIIASKTRHGIKEVVAVECKNYQSPVPVKDVRDFIEKLRDLGIKNGLFAARPDFSSEAEQWGQNAGLRLWSEDTLKEKYFEVKIGRVGAKGPEKLQHYLPLKISYTEAAKLNLENKEKVEIESAKLIWKPFYKIAYTLKGSRTDPRREKHTIEDSGYWIVDALSGNVLEHSEVVKNVVHKLLGQSAERSHQIKEIDIYLKELDKKPDMDLVLEQSQEYRIIVYKPIITEEKAIKIVVQCVVEDNTRTDYYTLAKDKDSLLPDQKPFEIVPSPKEVRIIKVELVHVPKWEMEFKSKEFKYIRNVTGNSGATIYDTITNCNKHLTIGSIGPISIGKKKNAAACGVCGEILCKDHVFKCPTCGSWRCGTHSVACTSCKESYCQEHITNKCVECESAVCDACSISCPICHEIYCKKHITKCSKCQRTICLSCSRKEGGILSLGQKVFCKECLSK